MIQIRLSADSSNELQRAQEYIAERYNIRRLKTPEKGENSRYKSYIFVTEKPQNPSKQADSLAISPHI